jgi:Cytochrome P450
MQLLIQLKEKGKLTEADDEETTDAPDANTTSYSDNIWINFFSKMPNFMNTELTEDDIVAQALVFFIAGFETSSTSLTFAMMEMARKPSVQKKAKLHIEEVLAKHNGVMSYQALQEMTYLDWIIQGNINKRFLLTEIF